MLMVRPIIIALAVAWSLSAAAAEAPLIAFDNGVGRGELDPVQQAALLKDLGYAGIGYTGVGQWTARRQAFAAAGLAITSLYVGCQLGPPPRCDAGLLETLPQLAGSGTMLWLTVGGSGDDAMVDAAVRLVAEPAAQHHVQVALYPHFGMRIATALQALSVVQRLALPNVGLMLNLCHELRAGNEARLPDIIHACAPALRAVSINGAEHDGDWNRLIKPLGEGAVDVMAVMDALRAHGYAGPVGLQCYNVPGDQRAHLAASMAAWRRMQAPAARP
jgi:sugar phosphate isomerase/epimerase